jgi:uncharacterized membrane protein
MNTLIIAVAVLIAFGVWVRWQIARRGRWS